MKAGRALAYALVVLITFWLTTVPVGEGLARAAAPERPDAEPAVAQDIEISISQVVVSGLTQPVQVTHAGDGSNRLFIVEQTGTIRILKGGVLLPQPFLDISDKTTSSGERGLLGVAFHPLFGTNGRFFINYTRASDGATIVAEVHQSTANPDLADPATQSTILEIPQPATNHNGGQVMFGPDGYLYIGMGDGGGGGDPYETAQDPTSLLGAMLRIDVDGGTPYAIPPGNPYVGESGRDEIWAIGLRNPWRFSFDRSTGDLYIGDVGQNQWEEIDYLPSGSPGGANFGWDCLEGTHQYEWDSACAAATFVPPIAEYSHTEGRSVTGGFVYRGARFPALVGRYFYADYVDGKIWSLQQTSPGVFGPPELELDTSLLISSFGEDEDGELYVVDRNGTVRLIADASPDLTQSYKQPESYSVDPGESFTYTVAIVNSGSAVSGTVRLTDTVPAGLSYVPGTVTATTGNAVDSQQPQLTWTGTVGDRQTVTITYQVQATGAVTGGIVSLARLNGTYIDPIQLPSAVFVPRSVLTTTMQDLFLPGTQPNGLAVEIANSIDCDTCHNAPIYDAWRGTMMGQAGRDPLMWAALAAANWDAPSAGDYCLRCHVSTGWLEGRSHPASGVALTVSDIDNGVACALCHRMVDPVPSGGETAGIDMQIREALTTTVPITYAGSSTLIVDPIDRRRGPFAFSPGLPYHEAYQSSFVGQASAPEEAAVARARLCGTCHDVDNPVLSWNDAQGQYLPNAADTPPDIVQEELFPIERTYTEWRNSAYPAGVYAPEFAGAKPDGIVSACPDCHMERQSGIAADGAFDPVFRDCSAPVESGGEGCVPEHRMVGGNAWVPQLLSDPSWRLAAASEADYLQPTVVGAQSMLHRAATLTATLVPSGTQRALVVRVTNETGHKLPTGYPEGRQMWLHVRAFDAAGNLVYESGKYDDNTGYLIRDDDIRVYEAKQGITPELASVVGLPPGPSFHFILNNTILKDNRIPPRGYAQAQWDQPGLRPVGASFADGQYWDEVTYGLSAEAVSASAVLYYQTASAEYIDFLRRSGGVDGVALHDLWMQIPSSPVTMAIASVPPHIVYLPVIARSG